VFSYLYKYLYKGPDCTFFSLGNEPESSLHVTPINEVENYQKARYLSAPEAACRILGFNITRKEPSVEGLPVHLPGQNTPQFRRRDGIHSSVSLLDQYFLCSEELLQLRYEEYFEQYILYPYWAQDMLMERDFLEKQQIGVTQKKAS